MKVSIGGKDLEVARLTVWDVCELQASGHWDAVVKFTEAAPVARTRAMYEVMAAAVCRAGGKVTARELMEQSYPEDVPPLLAALPKVLRRDGVATEDASPNAQSPGATGSTSADSSGASVPHSA